MRLKPWLICGACVALAWLLLFAAFVGGPGPGTRAGSGSPPPGSGAPNPGPLHELRFARRVTPPAGRSHYAGSEACLPCHGREAHQARSRHARTLAEVDPAAERARFQTDATVMDSMQGIGYQCEYRGGRCAQRAYVGSRQLRAEADFAFGAGNVGVTYLSRRPEGSLQLRLSWYPKHGWAFTPGLGPGSSKTGPLGEELDAGAEIGCFSCHATLLVRGEGGLDLDRSILSVGCEACHGPGAAHIEAARRGAADLKMARLSARRPEAALHVCGPCHGAPGSVALDDPMAAAGLPRLQTAALAMSRCATEGELTCVTCHDPHGDADQTPRVTYNRVCGSCHRPGGTAAKQACPVKPKGDCVSCHMPAQSIRLPNGRLFRNHWIKVWDE